MENFHAGGTMKAQELKYTKSHIWVHVSGDVATIGLSEFAQQEMGDIVFVEMPEKGKKAKKDETVGTVESVKSVSDILAPLSGEVVETNKTLEDAPETINKDPLGSGWVLKLKMSNSAEIAGLMDFAAYAAFTESER
jgi:glycine cleavage system H protein